MTIVRIFLLADRLNRSERALAWFLIPVIVLSSVKKLSVGTYRDWGWTPVHQFGWRLRFGP
jgi:hypothetical protein